MAGDRRRGAVVDDDFLTDPGLGVGEHPMTTCDEAVAILDPPDGVPAVSFTHGEGPQARLSGFTITGADGLVTLGVDQQVGARRVRHHVEALDGTDVVREGSYIRQCDGRRIQRFRCRCCRKRFGQQTFALTYGMRRPELLMHVVDGLRGYASLRAIARSWNARCPERPVHPSSIARIARRIGAHAALLLEFLHDAHVPDLAEIENEVAFDHFETFVGLQENALAIGTPVGATSGWIYPVRAGSHRRATSRSRARPRVAPSPGDVARSTRACFARLERKTRPGDRATLTSDDHDTYPRALDALPHGDRFVHEVFPNPPSRRRGAPRDGAARERDRRMWRVDRLHMLLRHLVPDHRRESIVFARRIEAALERVHVLVLWINLEKPCSIRRGTVETPAMVLGIADRPVRLEEMMGRRLFVDRVGPDASTRRLVERRMRDPRGVVGPDRARMRTP